MLTTMPMTRSPRQMALFRLLSEFETFCRACYADAPLRAYQLGAALPVLAAIERGQGGSFVWMFSRQAGKDETLARLQAFLLARYRLKGGALVMGTPTFKPQALVSRRRLLARTATPLHPGIGLADGYRVQCGAAGTAFLSAEPSASVRGETADVLLMANEAQDIEPAVWDARFSPMAASTNAPALFAGTPWAAGSLLARESADLAAPQLARVDWQQVAHEVPAYGEHVKGRIRALGATHPFIRTEYCLEELDAQGGLFPPARQAQMRGQHARQYQGTPGRAYALLLDVAGADEDAPDDPTLRVAKSTRDATALTVVEVARETIATAAVRRPTYRVVGRYLWTNVQHPALLPKLVDMARQVWRASWLIGDATGLGHSLVAFLGTALQGTPVQVVPFVFSLVSKSDLGWAFLGAIDSGRYKEYADDGQPDTRLFWAQVAECRYSVLPGPGKVMRWAVPESKGHDDLLLSAALVGVLEGQDWRSRAAHSYVRSDYA